MGLTSAEYKQAYRDNPPRFVVEKRVSKKAYVPDYTLGVFSSRLLAKAALAEHIEPLFKTKAYVHADARKAQYADRWLLKGDYRIRRFEEKSSSTL